MKKETTTLTTEKEYYTAAIVMARCTNRKLSFGIRWESSKPKRWVANWTFVIKESSATREGYDKVKIKGRFKLDDAYPGCPHCGATGIVTCGCGKSCCWTGQSEEIICPWCGKEIYVLGWGWGGGSLFGGSDR